jgi:hypothetical protein
MGPIALEFLGVCGRHPPIPLFVPVDVQVNRVSNDLLSVDGHHLVSDRIGIMALGVLIKTSEDGTAEQLLLKGLQVIISI